MLNFNPRGLIRETMSAEAIVELPLQAFVDIMAEHARDFLGCEVVLIDIPDHNCAAEGLTEECGLSAVATRSDWTWCSEDASLVWEDLVDPLVAWAEGFTFYAGIPLRSAKGTMLGTLVALDSRRHALDDQALNLLKGVGVAIVARLDDIDDAGLWRNCA